MMPAEDFRDLGDVLIDREVSKEEVRSAFCSLLSLGPEQVAVFEDDEEVLLLGERVQLLCRLVSLKGGDFPTLLSPTARQLADMPRISTAVKLCQLLNCHCLVDDGSINPFTYLLVDGSGQWRKVGLDTGRMDSDEYVIASDAG